MVETFLKPNKRPEESEDESGNWILTFADLMTLLLTFFVLLYSFSKTDVAKFNAIVKSLRITLVGPYETQSSSSQILNQDILTMQAQNVQTLNDLLNKELNAILTRVNKFIYEQSLQSKIKAFIDHRGVVIKVSDDVFFESGEADLNPRSKTLLEYLTDLIRQYPYPLRVEGHTDNRPIHTDKFPSNWELSTMRATTVVRYFIDQGLDPRLFSAEGFAEYRPVASNGVASGRAKNRRVEIIYKKDRIMEHFQNLKVTDTTDLGEQ